MLETVEALRKQGHECIEFEPALGEEHWLLYVTLLTAGAAREAMYLFVALTSTDGYRLLTSHLGPDPQVRCQKVKRNAEFKVFHSRKVAYS